MSLHRFEKNSKFGYRYEDDTIAILAKYDDAKEFKENLAIVKYNGFFGVINSSDIVVIDFIYSTIEEHNLFFECKETHENDSQTKSLWYNRDGVLLHEGFAKALTDKCLCISNGKKYGVISKDSKRIINCLYDDIVLKNNLLIVLRGDKLGLYDLEGNVILDAFCYSIESVIIENDWQKTGTTTFNPHKPIGCYYPGFCKEYYFDSNNYPDSFLKRERIFVKKDFWNKYSINFFAKPIEDINKPLIISTDKEKILFLKSDGVVLDGEFEDIQQLTCISYAVKKNNLWGIYRLDTKSFIIPIEYDSISFYGGHTVLLCKNGLWGAKSLMSDSNIFNKLFNVSIPNEYLEIKILDDYQHFFGCKKKCTYSSNEYYTIVRSNGEESDEFDELECNNQFVYLDDMHFLTSIGGKFGFVNPQGQKIIPFKYDEIVSREDGRFDARISDRWGVLTIDGFEVARIKYSSPLSKHFDKEIIVKDAESECFGLLSPDGTEMIPTIYEHLLDSEDDGLFYFGYGGFEDLDHPTFFSGDINGALWGVVSCNGKRIIDAKYLNFKIQYGYIVAGRDGGYFPDMDNSDYGWYGSIFDGVYDLYNKEGELLIGGFREFEYDERNGIFIFFFGGEWKEYSAFDDDWNNIHITGSKFERGIDLWLILDKDFRTILRDKDGNPKQFEKGFIGKIDIKQEDSKIKHVYNMPIELMAKGFSHVAINSIIINDNNSDYHKSQAVDIKTGKKTLFYSQIEQITESLFFFADGNTVGICSIDSIEIENCLFITYPVNNYILVAENESEETCKVSLYSISPSIEFVSSVITSISIEDVIHLANENWLKFLKDDSFTGVKALTIPNSRYLDKTFLDIVSTREGTDHVLFSHNKENVYFFTNDYRLLPEESGHDDGGYYEKNDNYSIMDALDGDPDAYWNVD